MNKSGQTAYDVARFWGHKHIATLLSGGGVLDRCPQSTSLNVVHGPGENIYFNHEFLDRSSNKRTDTKWLATKKVCPHTVYIVFHNLNPLVTPDASDDSNGKGMGQEGLVCMRLSVFLFLVIFIPSLEFFIYSFILEML